MSEILVVGGAGYIGSHMVKRLLCAGYKVTVLDDLSGGRREAVPAASLVTGSVANTELLQQLFTRHRFTAVMHFASYIVVSDSVTDPSSYYANNVTATLKLLDAMCRARVKHFIFSSTAAVYGNPQYSPIDEQHPLTPINPYGHSKRMVEQILEDYDRAYGMKSVSLRYFNAAGADPDGELGECHEPETHLIPLILQAASGRRENIAIYGDDYDTRDGTCVRDYIHVNDICQAHLLALQFLLEGNDTACFNLGNGCGYSVREVIEATRKITGEIVRVSQQDRRPGDPARLVADARKAGDILGWQPERSSLDNIIQDAWRWERLHNWSNQLNFSLHSRHTFPLQTAAQ